MAVTELEVESSQGVDCPITEAHSVLSIVDEGQSSSSAQSTEKDPRKNARQYQLDLCKIAVEENIIVYLGTGCGKTHIAVLLIYALGHLIRKPQKNICVFLAPTVALVQQQAKVIKESIDFKVGTYGGRSKRLKGHLDWEKEIEQYEILVMIPEILLRNLSHCFIRRELISLLIFDECHHAQARSNHPYTQIMKAYNKLNIIKPPRIFGMTASPIVGKGASEEGSVSKCINSLEKILDAKVYSVEDTDLKCFVASPEVKIYYYGPVTKNISSSHILKNLEEIKRQCISMLSKNTEDHSRRRSIKKMLCRLHDNLIFCLEKIGLWGALQASRRFLSVDYGERNELLEAEENFNGDLLCDNYLAKAASFFSSHCMRDGVEMDISSVDVLKEPFFSKKLLCLIRILSNFRLQPNMKCIVFVNRIVVAQSLSYILQNLKFLASWKCGFLVGVHSGMKSMSRKNMKNILEKFRSGQLNLLVATKVGEEGLDIQTCCLVIRFDLPETVASFIQSRGRARMPQSEYAFLVNSGNNKELALIENFKTDEDRMNKEIFVRTSSETFADTEEKLYKVDSSGASITAGYSVSLIHHYCAMLPHDEYFDPKPEFYFFDDEDGTVCHIIFPSNSPLPQVISTPEPSIEEAKRIACLKACEQLHKIGALNDYLLPCQDIGIDEESMLSTSDSGVCEGSILLRGELHEMLIPAALRQPWTNLENSVYLNSYFIRTIPCPEDRVYKKFGFLVKAPLPKEAERMKLDLQLAHQRSVSIELIPSGLVEFNKNEILQAQNFQEMFLKIILHRSEFVSERVQLGDSNDSYKACSSTFYLLLPVILNDDNNKITVDWKSIKRCLSSPIFRNPAENAGSGYSPLIGELQLANGSRNEDEVVNSLVYAPYKNAFFFVADIIAEKNGYSTSTSGASHVDHFKTLRIQLSRPEQPLLKAKQLFSLRNLLHDRKKEHSGSETRESEEHFFEVPPELCELKIIGFSKDFGSTISLLPSIMHRLENLLVAIELKHALSTSFPEGAEVTADRVLEALTTAKCMERFSLERLEVLGDAFLKYVVGRHLFLFHDALDEGELTRRRSNIVNNSNLFKMATRNNLQVYIRDQSFDPSQFYALGHPCPVICSKGTENYIHSQVGSSEKANGAKANDVRCSKCHHWLHRKTISDVVEALVGAFLVDSGFKAAISFLRWIGITVDFDSSHVNNIYVKSSEYLSLVADVDIPSLEKLIGYLFQHKGLLLQAFVHPSYNKHGGGCYQRLEYLGDAVLDYLITSYLYSTYPKLKPGQLTDLRSVCVDNKSFANVAVQRSFHKFLLCDSSNLLEAIDKYVGFIETPSSEDHMIKEPKCPKVLGDLVESSVGAVLLDNGFNLERVWEILFSFLDPVMIFSSFQLHPVRELQELCQSKNWQVVFRRSQDGSTFSVEAKVDGEGIKLSTCATNISRKEAKKVAAQQAIAELKHRGYMHKSKTVEEVIKSSCKMEAKLIGYNEAPINSIPPDAIESEPSKVLEPSRSNFKLKKHKEAPLIKLLSKGLHSSVAAAIEQDNENAEDMSSDSQIAGQWCKKTAKSVLHEVCADNSWKAPIYECVKEEGPSHQKLFTFKVVLEIEDSKNLECFGEPRGRKKDAAEHAAEGALWYLQNTGFLPTRE